MSSFYRKLALSVILIAALLSAGVMIARWLSATKPVARRSDIATLPPLVRVQKVVPQAIQEIFVGYGSGLADVQVSLTAEVPGVVVEIADGLKDGSEVARNRLLARIDDRDYRAELARAESLAAEVDARLLQLDTEKQNAEKLLAISTTEVTVNRDELARLANLFEASQASKREMDVARVAYQRSRRQLQEYKNQLALIEPRRVSLEATRNARRADAELARLRVGKCKITAPFAGQVQHISVDVGDRVQRGSEMLHLISTRLIEVPVELPASVRQRVAIGAACVLTVDTIPGVSWEGRVARMSPVVHTASRTFAAYVEVDNEKQATPLLPGYFLTAKVAGPILSSVLAVPRGAVMGTFVYVANRQMAHARTVEVERYIDERAIVSGELHGGDLVILTNLDKLFDGASVRIEPARTSRRAGRLEMGNSISTLPNRAPAPLDVDHRADPVLLESER